MTDTLHVWSPWIQLGFAGFAFALLGVVVWLVRQLLRVLRDNTTVICGNTSAIESVNTTADETRDLMRDVRDQLLARPCLMSKREQDKHLRGNEDRT